MSKKTPAAARTETVIAGQPSAGLLAELKRAGEKVTVEQLAVSLGHLEAGRVGFAVEATATGILLVARKQTLDRGAWQPFCAEVWQVIKATGSTASDLDNFTRSLRVYTFLAQHFLADLEQNAFEPEGEKANVAPAVKPAEVLALDTLPQEKRVAVYGAIERFVAGRSLRRMLTDFRRAENAADQEEIDEKNRRKKKGKKDDPAQMDFFDTFKRPLDEIETLLDSADFQRHATKDELTRMAVALEAQAKICRARAKETRA